ncbi:MAG: M1 family aminopeptidase, partial [Candidatus Zixiibacteriota bacterium]
ECAMRLKAVTYCLLFIFCLLISAFADEVSTIISPDDINQSLTPNLHEILSKQKAEMADRYLRYFELNKSNSKYDQTEYDVTYYDIAIIVNEISETVAGQVKIEARSLIDGLDTIEVDFFDNMVIDSIYGSSGLLNFSRLNNRVTIELDKSYSIGELFAVVFEYSGTPEIIDDQGFSFDRTEAGDVSIYTLGEPYMARSWWPCKDRPDDKPDSVDISVICNDDYYCVCNGKRVDSTGNGDGTTTYQYSIRYPIATYLVAVTIGEYRIWTDWYKYSPTDSMPIIFHVFPEYYNYSLSKWNITDYVLTVFSDIFGEYPFINEKYGLATVATFTGLENQTITIGAPEIAFAEDFVVHETAHQWWGDMITCNSFHETWLNEGFATYSEALYFEQKYGNLYYHTVMNQIEHYYSGTLYIVDTTSGWNMFGSIVYNKGAWVLHMLRNVVGDEEFIDILQAYYNSIHQYADATGEDFKNICESVTGLDLDYFFDEWVYGERSPQYKYMAAYYFDADDNIYHTYLKLSQTQETNPTVYEMPIDIDLKVNPYSGETFRIFNNSRDTVLYFETSFEPNLIEVDPDNWIYGTVNNIEWTIMLVPTQPDTILQYWTYSDNLIALGGDANNRFEILSGNLPSGIELDSLSGEIFGLTSETGQYPVEIEVKNSISGYADTNSFDIVVAPYGGLAGDADYNLAVNILDITFLINYLYKEGTAPVNPILADPNNSCNINILDITYLISYLYKNGPDPQFGCAIL